MTISNTPKVAYIYKDGFWYPISSTVNTAANYDWTGLHDFSSVVTFEEVVRAKAGVNNFQNPAARDAAINQTPIENGTVVFVREDAQGELINQIQYRQGSSWVNYSNIRIREKSSTYEINLHDVDNLIEVNSTSNLQILIPAEATVNFPIGSRIEILRYGTGEVTVAPASGAAVTIRSKLNNTRISSQYSGAMLTKIGVNEWHLIGDLKAAV